MCVTLQIDMDLSPQESVINLRPVTVQGRGVLLPLPRPKSANVSRAVAIKDGDSLPCRTRRTSLGLGNARRQSP